MKFATTTALALLLAAAGSQLALAQTSGNQGAADTPPAAASGVLAAIDKETAPVPQLNLMVGQVEEMDLVGPNGEDIGEVDDVLGDAAGNAKAITVEVGGFLGIGEKRVILMLSDVSLDMGRIQTKLTKEEIEKLPAFGG